MKARPILFSAPMIRALLDGTKTQTRRVVKQGRGVRYDYVLDPSFLCEKHVVWFGHPDGLSVGYTQECPYGKPGDLLWVRESCAAKELTTEEADAMWKASPDYDGLPPDHLYGLDGVAFSADNAFAPIKNTREAADAWVDLNAYRGQSGATVPPIHMPRWASRLTLRITDVRVERLQDISEADAIAEGIGTDDVDAAVACYGALWDRINGPGSWEANPWVWCLSFEVLRQNVDEVRT